MFRGFRDGWDAGRGLLLAAIAIALGAAVLAGGDPMSIETSRVEATQAAASPVPLDTDVGPPTTVAVAPLDTPSPAPVTSDAPVTPAAAAPAPGTGFLTASPSATPTTAPPTTRTSNTGGVEATTSTTTTTRATPTTTTAAAPAPAPVVRTGPSPAPGVEAEIVPLTNRDRAANGLGPLTRNACLDGVASGYAEGMARSGVLAHNPGAGPAITTCQANATWGDNVGTSEPCDTTLLEQRWMASPGHRRNILTGAFRQVGVGAWNDEQGGCWVQVLFSS